VANHVVRTNRLRGGCSGGKKNGAHARSFARRPVISSGATHPARLCIALSAPGSGRLSRVVVVRVTTTNPCRSTRTHVRIVTTGCGAAGKARQLEIRLQTESAQVGLFGLRYAVKMGKPCGLSLSLAFRPHPIKSRECAATFMGKSWPPPRHESAVST
jgi:hypothetical protein